MRKSIIVAAGISLAIALMVGTGCRVPAHEQRLVSKANMQFSRNPVFGYSSRIMPQIQSGLDAGAEQASVCTLCK